MEPIEILFKSRTFEHKLFVCSFCGRIFSPPVIPGVWEHPLNFVDSFGQLVTFGGDRGMMNQKEKKSLGTSIQF